MKRERLARIKNMRQVLKELDAELEHWILESVDEDGVIVTAEQEESYPRIEDIKAGEENLTLKAQVKAKRSAKGNREDGSPWELTSLTIGDGTSNIDLILWGEQQKKADGLKIDDWAVFKVWKAEIYESKRGVKLQLILGPYGTITRLSD